MSKEISLVSSKLDGVLNESGVTVVRFTANWCGPCRMLAPVFEELSEEITDVKFLKCDVDELKDMAIKFGVRSIPYIMVVDKDLNILADVVGSQSKDGLIKLIKEAKNKLV